VTLLTPVAGAILAAVILPPLILLYFLKLRRRSMSIPSTLLWKRAVEDLHANAPFQKLRKSLLLLLQLLVILALAAAIMQPVILSLNRSDGRTVLIIDNSASMTATDTPDGQARLNAAREAARRQIETMYSGGLFAGDAGETMIIAFSDRAEVMSKFTDSRNALLAAIDQIQPTHARTSMDEALQLARAYTTNVIDPITEEPVPIDDPPRIILFSDGRIEDLGDLVLRGESLQYQPFGRRDADNVAITSISVERPYDKPSALEIFAAVVNYAPDPVTCDLQLSIDDRAPGIKAVSLPAAVVDETGTFIPGRSNVLFQHSNLDREAVVGVKILREDDLQADNEASVVVPPPKRLKVALVGPPRLLTRMVLEGMALERLDVQIPSAQYEQMAANGPLTQYDVVIFDGYIPASLDLMPPGHYLCFGAPPPFPQLNAYGEDVGGFVLTTDTAHPIFEFVNLDDLAIRRQHLIEPGAPVEVIAESVKGPLIVTISDQGREVVYVAFDPMESNWPFLRSYVTFIFNAVEYLGRLNETFNTQGFAPGDALTLRVPATATDLTITPPDGNVTPITPTLDSQQISWGPVRLSGIHLFKWNLPDRSSPVLRPMAVNMLSEQESDIRTVDTISIGEQVVESTGRRGMRYRPLWPWAVGLALTLLMIEWWVYHRKAFV
jgi:uncharacterized protein YegL